MIKVEDIPEDRIVFYDIETDGVYAPYCNLKMIGYQIGINGEPQLVDPNSKESMEAFRMLVNSEILKVGFNTINFDDIVLWRYGFFVNPKNRHDMYLALKTIHPTLPSYSLKFANWLLDADQTPRETYHFWEGDMYGYMKRNFLDNPPMDKLGKYCKHDVRETANVFRGVWEKVQEDQHWRPYTTLEIAMGEPLHEMILLGRELIDIEDIKRRIVQEKNRLTDWDREAGRLSNGKIKNVLSTQQVTRYLNQTYGVNFEKSELGHMLGRKSDWLKLMDAEDQTSFQGKSRIAKCIYEARDASKVIGYLRSYLRAGIYERRWQREVSTNSQRKDGEFLPVNFRSSIPKLRSRVTIQIQRPEKTNNNNGTLVWIPKSYGLSTARTRRFRSSSKFSYIVKGEKRIFGINWQNQNKRSKVVQLVPKGWLGWWLDSTQIENVVHIWASGDNVRRAAYEADPNWNEYVWLTNMILGGELTRTDLDKIDSTVNPSWSVYKQYKTIKLALNFGMGPEKFARETGLSTRLAVKEFAKVHKACPAIRRLQGIVREAIVHDKYIEDPFGHIYSGNKEDAYKVVAYLVQGCGTGSVPKAMTVANYETLHSLDSINILYTPYIQHPFTRKYSYGMLCGTTHDECAGRLSLGLPTKLIIKLIKELLYNMEGRFSHLFDGIPLRAKLAVSISNAAEQEELDHRKDDFEERLIYYIEKGKEKNER